MMLLKLIILELVRAEACHFFEYLTKILNTSKSAHFCDGIYLEIAGQ